jgi:hypothetical protein
MAYVQVVINRVTGVLIEDSIEYAPTAREQRPFEWKVVSDVAGKVVVRERSKEGDVFVVATAHWRELDLVDPEGTLTTEQWRKIADHLRPILERAHNRHTEPGWIDDGAVPPPVPTFVPAATPGAPTAEPAPFAPPGATAGATQLPYVELVVDYTSDAAAPGTVRYRPDPSVIPGSAFRAKVVCDSMGKVVVRNLDTAGKLEVVGTAVWRGDAIRDPVVGDTGPSSTQWGVVEKVLRNELALALRTNVDYDRAARETANVPRLKRKGSKMAKVLGAIGTGAVLLGVIAIVFLGDRCRGHGNRPNGIECIVDRDCASDNCFHRHCKPPGFGVHNLAPGERCDYDRECSSGGCFRGVCQQH